MDVAELNRGKGEADLPRHELSRAHELGRMSTPQLRDILASLTVSASIAAFSAATSGDRDRIITAILDLEDKQRANGPRTR
jgi:hypothetical protein